MARSLNEIKNYLKSQFYYDAFCYNLKEQKHLDIDDFVRAIYSNYAGKNIISTAFSWENTIEGGEFWNACARLYDSWFYANDVTTKTTMDEFLKTIHNSQIF